ncbi:NmrA family protein [Zymoseptoria brevis]|uniref:NmrA family protein n=1 Tax=Zymoseptoria brevis TaxID=1047168 RepID=A0A0F4GT26_9PEZI|nr:NmrA family protein [Zymoseptoria brevis]
MHILLVGATGPSGIAFAQEALVAGHRLTIFARNPTKLPENISTSSNVTIVKGEFDDMEAARKAIQTGATALISFAGPQPPAKGTPVSAFYDRFFRLIKEDKENSIRRCLVLATPSFQVAEDRSSWKWWFIVSVIRMLGGDAYADIVGIGKVVSALPVDEVEWTLFRVPVLTNGDYKPVQTAMVGDGNDGLTLSRKSNAVWVLQELEEKKWVGRAPALSNPA